MVYRERIILAAGALLTAVAVTAILYGALADFWQRLPVVAAILLPIILFSVVVFWLQEKCRKAVGDNLGRVGAMLDSLDVDGGSGEKSVDAASLPEEYRLLYQKSAGRCLELHEENNAMATSRKVFQYQKNRLESILNHFPDAVLFLDESGKVSYANDKTSILLGVDRKDLLGKEVHEWCDREEIVGLLGQYGSSGGRIHRAEMIELAAPGRADKTIAVMAVPLDSASEEGIGYGSLVLVRDVSAEAGARQARKEFVAHVSHELKAPLNVLSMYCELLQGEEGKNEEFRIEAVNVIADEVDRLATLVQNLLSISKIEMGNISLSLQRVKVLDFLKDTFDAVSRGGRGKGLRFSLDLPHDMSPLSLDKGLFQVAISNLLTNAIKYNKEGGEVKLTAEESGEQIVIRVIDTGIGIASDEQEKIFEKFYRSEDPLVRDQAGHGLGLALAKSIIELHRGRLQTESSVGKGTTMSVIFDKRAGLVQEGIL